MPAPESGPASSNPGPERPFQPRSALVIGLVGGIAAGKSTVAGLFGAHGIQHVDADFHARLAAQDPEALREVAAAAELGARFVQGGQLDRAALASHIFQDPVAKQRLEAILHPRVRQRILAQLEAARAADQTALLDVPLLFEAGLYELCDTIVFVATSEATRQERARSRGWQDGELARREANQMPLADKQARSQHVIHNDRDLAQTAMEVEALLRDLAARQ